MPLSNRNPQDVCFCHQKGNVVIEHPQPICTSRDPAGWSQIKLDYYGLEGGYQHW